MERVREEGEWNHNFKCSSQYFFKNKMGKKMNQRLLDHKFSQLALLDQQFYLVNQLVG